MPRPAYQVLTELRQRLVDIGDTTDEQHTRANADGCIAILDEALADLVQPLPLVSESDSADDRPLALLAYRAPYLSMGVQA